MLTYQKQTVFFSGITHNYPIFFPSFLATASYFVHLQVRRCHWGANLPNHESRHISVVLWLHCWFCDFCSKTSKQTNTRVATSAFFPAISWGFPGTLTFRKSNLFWKKKCHQNSTIFIGLRLLWEQICSIYNQRVISQRASFATKRGSGRLSFLKTRGNKGNSAGFHYPHEDCYLKHKSKKCPILVASSNGAEVKELSIRHFFKVPTVKTKWKLQCIKK